MAKKLRWILRKDGVRQRYRVSKLRDNLEYSYEARAWGNSETLEAWEDAQEHHPLSFSQFEEEGRSLRGKVGSVLTGNGMRGKLEVAYDKTNDVIVVQSKRSKSKIRLGAKEYTPTTKLEARFVWDSDLGDYRIISYQLDGKDRQDLMESVEGL